MTCWEDPPSTKLNGSKAILLKYRERIESFRAVLLKKNATALF